MTSVRVPGGRPCRPPGSAPPLARLEAPVVFEELSARLPGLRLVARQRLRFQPNTTFRGPLSLLVEWEV